MLVGLYSSDTQWTRSNIHALINTVQTITRSPTVSKVGRPYRLYPKVSVRLPVQERKRFPRVTIQSHTRGAADRTLRWTLGYDTVIWRTWAMAASCSFAFYIAAKPLQICMVILTVYKNSSSPCNACIVSKSTT